MQGQEFKLNPSKQYIALICIVFLLSLAIVGCLPINLLIKVCGWVLLSFYGGYLLWNNGLLRGHSSIKALICDGEGGFRIVMKSKMVTATLLGDSTVTGLVSILRFRIADRLLPISYVIFKDSLKPDRYRQLLVVLKMR